MTVTTQSYLTLRDIWSSYGDAAVLQAVNIDIRRGEFLTLLGPSGSGKSTLLMVLAGFAMPARGSIEIDGEDLVSVPPNRRDIGFVFQSYALFPHLSVIGNVLFPLRVRSISGEAAKRRALESLERVGLVELADRSISALSGGQRQRVAFARAVVAEPRVLLMDEPLSALDKNLREEMQAEIRKLHDALGITTIYVTHDQREAMTMADRIAVMNHGRIEQLDTPEGVYCRPASGFVANFMGQANVLPIDMIEADPGALETIERARRDGKSHVVARAEHLSLGLVSPTESGIWIKGAFDRAAFHGDSWLLSFRTPRGSTVRATLNVRDAAQISGMSPGTELRLWVAVQHLWFVAENPATTTAESPR